MGNNRTYSTPAVYSSTDKLDPVLRAGAVSSADLDASLRGQIDSINDISNALPIDEVQRISGQINVFDGRIKTLERERPFFGSRSRSLSSEGKWSAEYKEFRTRYANGDIWSVYPEYPSGVNHDVVGELTIEPGTEGVFRLAPRNITVSGDEGSAQTVLTYRIIIGDDLMIRAIDAPHYKDDDPTLPTMNRYWQEDSLYIKNESQNPAKIQYMASTISVQYNSIIPDIEDPLSFCPPAEFAEWDITVL